MSKVIKAYNQLPPNVKQSINNVAAKAATAAVKQVQARNTRNRQRSKTTRTRNGLRIYSPSDLVESKAIAPVSYATTWTSGNKSLRVHQTEVIGRISANSTWFPNWNANYTVATFPINPADPKTFPWLSYIARLYDKYRFYGLKFMYINSTNTLTEGNIMLSLDYDTLDAAPADLVQASQLAKYKVSPLYCPVEFSVPVNHPGNDTWLYTFDLSATTNTVDLKTYNLGNLFVSLDGVPQNGKDYGYLAVEYDVELLDKNPAISVFASKTYDSGAPAAKTTRSNVDPADTMVVTVTWAAPASATTTNKATLTFSDDVDVGAKARVGLYLATSLTPNSSGDLVGFGTPTAITEGTSVLSTDTRSHYANGTASSGCDIYVNVDVTVPEDRTVELSFGVASTCKFSTTSSVYKSQVIAYTYA